MKTVIVAGSNSVVLSKKIANYRKFEFSKLSVSHFPDGELHIRFLTPVKGKHVVYVQSMHPSPNESMIEAHFTIKTAKELGAKRVTLVAPYLCYMRQDKRFRKGEGVTNKMMASILGVADRVITVDPHLHRIKSLNEIFKTRTMKLTANQILAEWIHNRHKKALLMGPDSESFQWAEKIAKQINQEVIVLKKKRYSSRKVRIKIPESVDVKGKEVVIVDDIVSTGHTMIEPVKQLKKRKAKKIYCLCVHGLFVENALKKLKKLGVIVYSTNTLSNSVSKIDVSKLIAEAL